MTARDLLQQRYTLPNGDTAWRHAPLVTAALEGKLVVLDGIHRVNPGTLAVLQRWKWSLKVTKYIDEDSAVDVVYMDFSKALDKVPMESWSKRLIHDRELTLYDGSRLLRTDRYEELKKPKLKARGLAVVFDRYMQKLSSRNWLTNACDDC
eukprot:g47481.t1